MKKRNTDGLPSLGRYQCPLLGAGERGRSNFLAEPTQSGGLLGISWEVERGRGAALGLSGLNLIVLTDIY